MSNPDHFSGPPAVPSDDCPIAAAVRGGPPGRLAADPWRYAVACHEAAHAVVGHALQLRVEAVTVQRRDTLLRGAMGEAWVQGQSGLAHATCDLAGCVGKAMALGVEYEWLTLGEALWIAATSRDDTKQRKTEPPPPDTPTPGKWSVPEDSGDVAAVATWVHGGRHADVTNALAVIDGHISTIPDLAERNCEREMLWTNAQADALRICRERLPEIKDLGARLCAQDGTLTAPELAEFFRYADSEYVLRCCARSVTPEQLAELRAEMIDKGELPQLEGVHDADK